MHLAVLIDALKGRGRQIVPRLGELALKPLRDAVSQAEAFDFGALHLEEGPPLAGPTGAPVERFVLPTLTPDEQEFFKLRAIPFPAPYCWYEYTIETPSAIVVDASRYHSEGKIRTTRIDFGSSRKLPILYTGLWCGLSFDNYREYTHESYSPLTRNAGADPFLDDAPYLAVYLTLMVNSRTTEIMNIRPTPQSNRLTRLRGRTPQPPHRVVTIVPQQFRYETNPSNPDRKIRHMRLHWRRSHMRHFERQTPNSIWLENLEHNGRKGWHVVTIPRFLVGKREEGVVSHEYRFAGEMLIGSNTMGIAAE
jgi:hypothetical protein